MAGDRVGSNLLRELAIGCRFGRHRVHRSGNARVRPGEDAADLSFVFAAAEEIAGSLSGIHHHRHEIERCRSARPRRSGRLSRLRTLKLQFAIASNPEFLREGTAVDDFLHPDRIVVGAEDERSRLS